MSEEIAKYGTELTVIDDKIINELRLKIQRFQKNINKEPKEQEIQNNKYADNTKYLPISFIEMNLDELFFGQWSLENFKYQLIGNELTGSIDLKILHPTSLVWLTRTGVASVIVRTKRDTDWTDMRNKIQNALVMDLPHLKAQCFRNACLSIGKLFGRDLNRKFTDNYQQVIKDEISSELDFLLIDLKNFEDKKELLQKKDSLIESASKKLKPSELETYKKEFNNHYRGLK